MNKRVLIVEDNPADVYLVKEALQDLDCELTACTDADEMMEFIEASRSCTAVIPDLVILDLNLPKRHGSDLLEAMRAAHALAAVPVIILTSSASPRERQQVEPFGIAHYLTKPADLYEFLQLVGSAVRQVLYSSSRT